MCMKSDFYTTLRCCTDCSQEESDAARTQSRCSTHHVFIDQKALSHGAENVFYEGNVFLCCIHCSQASHAFAHSHCSIGHGADDPDLVTQFFTKDFSWCTCYNRHDQLFFQIN